MNPKAIDQIDELEIFDLIKDIKDPEHHLTLEELNELIQEHIKIDLVKKTLEIGFTPTIPNFSSASLIGLIILANWTGHLAMDIVIEYL